MSKKKASDSVFVDARFDIVAEQLDIKGGEIKRLRHSVDNIQSRLVTYDNASFRTQQTINKLDGMRDWCGKIVNRLEERQGKLEKRIINLEQDLGRCFDASASAGDKADDALILIGDLEEKIKRRGFFARFFNWF